MTYRDEREALHARVESLRRELDDVQRRLDRLRLHPPSDPSSPLDEETPQGAAPGADSVAGAPLSSPSAMPPRTGRGDLLRWVFAVPPLAIATALMLAGICQLGVSRMPSPLPVARTVTATWQATVRSAEGHLAAPGTSCVVTGRFTGDGYRQPEGRVRVTCGGAVLYDWDEPQVGGSELRQCALWEGPEARGGHRYRLQCQDRGARTGGRPRLMLDTLTRTLELSRETSPAFRVVLDLDELSAPVAGPALYRVGTPSVPSFSPMLRTGTVLASSGTAVPPDQVCSVWVMPVPDLEFNCRVEVRCGDLLLYGAPQAGLTRCASASGVPTRALDEEGSFGDGDPQLDLDFVGDRVTVSDDLGDSNPSLTLSLDSPPTSDQGCPRLVDFTGED